MLRSSIAIGLVLGFVFCAAGGSAKDKNMNKGAGSASKTASIRLDGPGRKWAERTLRRMSTEEKVGQLFMIWARAQFFNEADPVWIQLRDQVKKYHVGSLCMTVPVDGPVLFKSQPYEAAEMLNRLQKDSKLPLIVAADFERGVSIRLNGATVFPHAMAFGATGRPENAEEAGRITGIESRAIGVHWNFFPVADVNSNPANPIINTRAYGGDAALVSDYVAAYIKGAHEGGMLTTAKHFPGHGDTATDSHLGVAQVAGDRARLEAVELPPFKRAIAAGVDAVMVAHVTVPALDPDPNHVATTSKAVVEGLLKGEMGFKGIVVTDALDMGGLTRMYVKDVGRAAVETFKAGNDVLIIPADLDASYRDVLEAVKSGEIPRARLDESVLKILELKASLGLHKNRLVDIDRLAQVVGSPENMAAGQHIADEAITLVRDNGRELPIRRLGTPQARLPYQSVTEAQNRIVAVIFSDDLRTESGRVLAREILARVPDAHVIYVDARSAMGMMPVVTSAVEQAEHVIAAVYSIPTAGKMVQSGSGVKNTVSMDEASATVLKAILDRGAARTIVLAMGNPYMISDFPAIENYVCAFSNVSVSETAAVKAIFGEINIGGHLPVAIPGVANRGDGLERAARAGSGGSGHGEN